MATKTATSTKSARFIRALAADPDMTISAAARKIDMVYSFAYGVAARTADPAHPGQSYADTRANRRGEKPVRIDGDLVIVRTATGHVTVNTVTGKTSRSK